MKTFLIIGITLLVLGLLLLFLGTMMSVSWGGAKVEEKSAEIPGSFTGLIVEELSADVQVLPSTDGKLRLEYKESEFDRLDSSPEDGLLRLTRNDRRPWYRKFFNQSLGTTTIYLPEADYQLLQLRTISGDLTLEGPFRAEESALHSISGDQSVNGLQTDSLRFYSVSGDLTLSAIDCSGELQVETTSGDITIRKLTAGSLEIESISGDCQMQTAELAGHLSIRTTSGEIVLKESDAKTLDIESVSGDVNLALKTVKRVEFDTVSGKVNIADSDSFAELCRIHTVSGWITVKHSKS